MTLPAKLPPPWDEIHAEVVAEMGPEWAERYGEASLRAAAAVIGDTIPEGPDPDE